MGMLTTGVVMSMGAEQGGLLQAQSGMGGVTGMSFAKSFDEVAAGVGIEAARLAGQTPMGGSAGEPVVVEKSVGAASIDPAAVQVKVPTGQVLSDQETVKSAVSGKSLDEPTEVLTAGKGTMAEVPVKSSVGPVSVVAPTDQVETAKDIATLQETAKVGQTQIAAGAPVPPAAALAEAQDSSRLHDGERLVAQKESRVGEKGQVTAPAKKETKSKGNAAASEMDAVGVSSGVAGGQVATAVPTVSLNGTAPVIASTDQRNKTAESDSNVVASASSRKTVAKVDGRGGMGHAQTERGAVKEARTVSSAGSDESVGRTQKGEAGLAKTVTVADEVKRQAQAGPFVATPVIHGATGLTVQSAGDATSTKTPMSGAGSSVVRVQEEATPVAMTVPVSEGHRTLTATPTTLEVGVANGTHGWLKVRAELTSSGVVNASLSSASSTGQEMLHRELPSLTAYLQEERVGVSSVVLHASTAESATGQFAGVMEGDAGRGQMQQSGGQSGDSRQGTEMTAFSDRADEAPSFEQMSGMDGAGWMAPAIYAGGTASSGSWLNVRA
jgi:hypothetical protein